MFSKQLHKGKTIFTLFTRSKTRTHEKQVRRPFDNVPESGSLIHRLDRLRELHCLHCISSSMSLWDKINEFRNIVFSQKDAKLIFTQNSTEFGRKILLSYTPGSNPNESYYILHFVQNSFLLNSPVNEVSVNNCSNSKALNNCKPNYSYIEY